MKLNPKKKNKMLFIILFVGVLCVGLMLFTAEKDPALVYHKTAWKGQLAFGKASWDGSYKIYSVIREGDLEIPGQHIATLPAGEAAKLR